MSLKKILIALLISATPSAYALSNDEEASNVASPVEQVTDLQSQNVFQREEANEVLREVRYESSYQRLNKVSEKSL